MIVCRQCGAESAEGDDFCGACGVFLEWEGEHVAPEEPEPEPEPDPDEEARKKGLVERVKTAIGMDDEQAAAAAAAAARAEEHHTPPTAADDGVPPAAVAAPTEVPPADAPAAVGTGGAAEPAAGTGAAAEPAAGTGVATDAPAADPPPPEPPAASPTVVRPAPSARAAAHVAKTPAPVAPGRASPEALKPAAPRRPPRPKAPTRPRREPRPGDLICGDCGEGNDADRKFCRRCGHSLAEAERMAIPWWRRLWRWLFRSRRKALAAGDRPDKWNAAAKKRRSGGGFRRTFRRLAMILIPLLVLSGFVGPLRPSVRSLARKVSDPVLDLFRARQDPIDAVTATAGRTAPGHVPENVIDGLRNTHWAELAPVTAEGGGLIVTFDGEVSLTRLGVTLATSPDPADFQTHCRPQDLHLVFSNGKTADITLADKADFQRIKVSAKKVTSVQINIRSIYPSLRGSNECGIAEIEFYGKAT